MKVKLNLDEQESELFGKNGFPKQQYPNGWKGKEGLYAAGFTKRGLVGVSVDGIKIAEDIKNVWKHEVTKIKKKVPAHKRCISTC